MQLYNVVIYLFTGDEERSTQQSFIHVSDSEDKHKTKSRDKKININLEVNKSKGRLNYYHISPSVGFKSIFKPLCTTAQ